MRGRAGQAVVVILAVIAGAAVSAVVILLLSGKTAPPQPQAVAPPPLASKITTPPVQTPADSSSLAGEREPTPQEIDAAMTQWIDSVGGHPDDPQLPPEVLGASDEVLAATNPVEVAELLQASREWVKSSAVQPRHVFALGRAAIVHGYHRLGTEYLAQAAQAGSPAAVAYEGYLALDAGRPDEAKGLLLQAEKLGFKSIGLTETLAAIDAPPGPAEIAPDGSQPPAQPPVASKPFDANDFGNPQVIQAFHDADFKILDEHKLSIFIYLTALNESLIASVYFVNDRSIVTELDRTLGVKLGRAVITDSKFVGDATKAGMTSALDLLMGVVDTRRAGGSVMDELNELNRRAANNPVLQRELLEKTAEQDGVVLATLYDTNREAFRKIYGNMKKYVNEMKVEQPQFRNQPR
jgi:hypothetical protein